MNSLEATNYLLLHDGRPYHVETNPLICKANQWTGFYMIGTSVMNDLISNLQLIHFKRFYVFVG